MLVASACPMPKLSSIGSRKTSKVSAASRAIRKMPQLGATMAAGRDDPAPASPSRKAVVTRINRGCPGGPCDHHLDFHKEMRSAVSESTGPSRPCTGRTSPEDWFGPTATRASPSNSPGVRRHHLERRHRRPIPSPWSTCRKWSCSRTWRPSSPASTGRPELRSEGRAGDGKPLPPLAEGDEQARVG